MLIVNIGWVFFRAETLTYAVAFLKKMFFIDTEYIGIIDPRYYLSNNVIIVMITGILLSVSVFKNTLNLELCANKKVEILKATGLIVVFVISIAILSATTYNPFIYFRF